MFVFFNFWIRVFSCKEKDIVLNLIESIIFFWKGWILEYIIFLILNKCIREGFEVFVEIVGFIVVYDWGDDWKVFNLF